ncbi:hypothetical protein Droror1_Dr00009707 [Drosera rotundifolia]
MVTAVEIYESMSGGVRFMASHHECGESEFDTERLNRLHHFKFPWAVNHTSLSPDQRLIVVVGEHKDALLASVTVPGREDKHVYFGMFSWIASSAVLLGKAEYKEFCVSIKLCYPNQFILEA